MSLKVGKKGAMGGFRRTKMNRKMMQLYYFLKNKKKIFGTR